MSLGCQPQPREMSADVSLSAALSSTSAGYPFHMGYYGYSVSEGFELSSCFVSRANDGAAAYGHRADMKEKGGTTTN